MHLLILKNILIYKIFLNVKFIITKITKIIILNEKFQINFIT